MPGATSQFFEYDSAGLPKVTGHLGGEGNAQMQPVVSPVILLELTEKLRLGRKRHARVSTEHGSE